MKENELSGIVINECFKIHTKLGPGLYESVYEKILTYQLKNLGLHIEKQVGIPVIWEDVNMNIGFRADIIVERKLIIEIKSIEHVGPVHFKQVLTYLRITDLKLGLLLNFNENLLKNGITRVVNGL